MNPLRDAARLETARIYSGLTREHHSTVRRLPRHVTRWETVRIDKALEDVIETAIARTGTIHGAMALTGCNYRAVQRVWRRLESVA